MIVLRFKVQCRPEKSEEVMAALADVIAPSRAVEGVISFDIARDLTDPNSFIATEVFENEAARNRQESMPQVGKVMAILPESLAAPPEATVFHVSSSEPAMA
jgi:quinol monooxygenase YgiN